MKRVSLSAMTESVSTSPFVIKVKKTSSDSWHIEKRDETLEMHDPLKTEADENITEQVLPVPICNTSLTDNDDAYDHDQPAREKTLTDSIRGDVPILPQQDNNTNFTESGEQLDQEHVSQPNDIAAGTPMCTLQDCAPSEQCAEKGDNMNEVVYDSDLKPKRWYTCASCAFSSLNLLGFLVHVHQTHFSTDNIDTASSGNESSLNRADHNESYGDQTGIIETIVTTVAPDSQNRDSYMHENINMNCHQVKDSNLGAASSRTSGKILPILQKPSDEIVAKTESNDISINENSKDFLGTFTANAGLVCDSMPNVSSPTTDEHKPFVNIDNFNVSKSHNGIDSVQQQQKMPSVFGETVFENKTFANGNDTSSLDKITKTSPKDVAQNGSRGSKINSIVNNLKECTANVSKIERRSSHSAQLGRTFVNNGQFPTLNNKSIETSNIFSGYDTNTAQPAIGQAPHTFSCNQSFTPQQNSHDNMAKSWSCDVGAGIGFPRRKQTGHFEDLQSLLASGCVTMPNATVLQSIKCSQDAWNHIQEMLHGAFSAFPYLTTQESQSLAQRTDLTVKQINTLFVVARLQHGISWEQHEIESARQSLSSIAKNRFQTCASQNTHAQNSLPVASTQVAGLPAAFSHLTKEQHDILKWSFSTIPLTTNELNRLEEVTMLEKAVILQYFRQLPAHLAPSQRESGVQRSHIPSHANLNKEVNVNCIHQPKKSTYKANNYFENSRFSINGSET